MINYEEYIKGIQDFINPILESYISLGKNTPDSSIAEAMLYSLMAGGKRIRPALCIGAVKALGKSTNEVTPLACALEMIHTYSLIHDDLPAMDNDDLRRGKLSCHKRFDEATAILAGNALLTLAFEILANVNLNNFIISPEYSLKIIHKLSIAAGFRGMLEGQIKDIRSEGIILSKTQLKKMHLLKTGLIIETSVTCGALMAQANKQQLRQLKDYGRKLGLAFQITDDILNVIGNSSKLGKATGTDLVRGKNTYPSIIGLEASKKKATELITSALDALKPFDNKANPLRSIGLYMLKKEKFKE